MRSVPPEVWIQYAASRLEGQTRTVACRDTGIAVGTASSFDRGDTSSSGHEVWRRMCRGRYPFAQLAAESGNERDDRIVTASLEVATKCPEAKMALSDFDYFRRRYFGEVSRPWHVAAAEAIIERLAEPGKSYLVMNAPPGTGKSTLIRSIAAWATVRNRAIRGARVANVTQLARREVHALRRHFERTQPPGQREDLIRAGLACDATSTLERDYGRFKPETREQWTAEAFVVMQPEGVLVAEKEPTWSAYGMDSAIIGNRFELLLGDDLDTPRSLRSPQETRAAMMQDWDNEIENRLEPDGLIAVLGQRLGRADIYRYLMDKLVPSESQVEHLDLRKNPDGRKYVLLKYPAHDDVRCTRLHSRSDPPQGAGGCLLDPYRMPWTEVSAARLNTPDTFMTVLQQEDGSASSHIVSEVVLEGGTDSDGHQYPGCYDTQRGLWDLPIEAQKYGISAIQVDPSGVAHWACQAWVYAPPLVKGVLSVEESQMLGHRRILLDVFDGEMSGSDLLDWNPDAREWFGKLEEWRRNYEQIGKRLQYVVVEVNAAQRYLLQFEHARRWAQRWQIVFLAHTTGVLKSDEKLGVYSLRSPYRFGLVRLPAKDPDSKAATAPLVSQLINYPGRRWDQVMCQWFGERNLPRMAAEQADDDLELPTRPSWLLQGAHR